MCTNHGPYYYHKLTFILLQREHSYAIVDADGVKNKIRVLEDKVQELHKQNRNMAVRERRLKQKCSDYMAILKEKNMLTSEMQDKLSAYKGIRKNQKSKSY